MKQYSAHGIQDFVICLGYKGYAINMDAIAAAPGGMAMIQAYTAGKAATLEAGGLSFDAMEAQRTTAANDDEFDIRQQA